MNKTLIARLEGITKFYKKTKALNNLNLEIPENEITCLIGPNGAGKTTTLKIISGFVKSYTGKFYKYFNNFSYVPEEKVLYNNYKISKLIEYNKKFTKNINLEIQNNLLNIFKINKNKYFRNLSIGQRTGLYLTIEFCRDTDFYILDEPTSGLDPIMKENFFSFLKDYNIRYRKTILIASHILLEIEEIADNIAIIKDGQIIEYNNLDLLKEKYKKTLKEIFLYLFNQEQNKEKNNVIY